MLFFYDGLDSKNRPIEGDIDARSERDALKKLQKRGYSITHIGLETTWQKFLRALKKVEINDKESVQFLKELSSVIKIGLSSLETMNYIAQNADENKKFRRIALIAAQQMQDGALMSEGMAAAGFKQAYCDVIAIGEATGNVVVAIESVISQIELSIETRKGFMGIYIAPMVTGTLMLAGTIAAIIFMVPMQRKIINNLASTPEEIPIWSRMAFWLGDYGVQVIVGLVVSIILFSILKRIARKVWHKVDVFFDVLALGVPVFGSFYRNAEISRVCSMLMLAMASGGNRQDEVLGLIRNQSNSIYFKDKLTMAHTLVKRDGYLMSDALDLVRFNGLVVGYTKRAEKTDTKEGSLMMESLAKEFAKKTLYNMELLKGASETFNMILLAILSTPIMLIMVAPSIDQITLTLNKF